MALHWTERQQVLTEGRLEEGLILSVNSVCSLPVVLPSWITDPPTVHEHCNTKAHSRSRKETVLVLGTACWGFAICAALLFPQAVWSPNICKVMSALWSQELQAQLCRGSGRDPFTALQIWAGRALHVMSILYLPFKIFFLLPFSS